MRTVIDTHVLVAALSSQSGYHWLIELLLEGAYELYLTEEIAAEYKEALKAKYSDTVAKNFLVALKELPNVHFFQSLSSSSGNDKFVDCYNTAGANYLITRDRIQEFEDAVKGDWEVL